VTFSLANIARFKSWAAPTIKIHPNFQFISYKFMRNQEIALAFAVGVSRAGFTKKLK